jgi:hypothetical protein
MTRTIKIESATINLTANGSDFYATADVAGLPVTVGGHRVHFHGNSAREAVREACKAAGVKCPARV